VRAVHAEPETAAHAKVAGAITSQADVVRHPLASHTREGQKAGASHCGTGSICPGSLSL